MLSPAIALSLFVLVSPVVATAQAPSVDDIIARHLVARGGTARLRAIETLVFSGGLYKEPGYKGSGNAFMAFRRPYLMVVGNPENPGGFMEGWDGSAWEWFADPGIVFRTVGAALTGTTSSIKCRI